MARGKKKTNYIRMKAVKLLSLVMLSSYQCISNEVIES